MDTNLLKKIKNSWINIQSTIVNLFYPTVDLNIIKMSGQQFGDYRMGVNDSLTIEDMNGEVIVISRIGPNEFDMKIRTDNSNE